MKDFVKVLAVLLFAVCLVGQIFAAGGGQSAPAAGKGRTVSFHQGAADNPEAQALTEKYYYDPIKAAFPNDTIQFIEFVDRQSLQIQVAGGRGPDVLFLDGPTDAVEFAKAGRLIYLDQYAAKYGWKDIFFEWAYNSGFHDGKLLSLPNSFEGMMLYINTDVFKKFNVAVPKTEAELLAACQLFQRNGIIPMSFGNSDYQGAVDWLYSTWNSCYAGNAKMKDALTGKARWDDPIITASVQQMVDYWQAGYIGDKKSQAITMEDSMSLFATGRAAMMVNGTWATWGLMNTYTDCNWEAVLMPELRPGVGQLFPLATGGVYCVNQGAANKDFAAEVLNWMFTKLDWHVKAIREASWQPFPVKAVNKDTFRGMDRRMVEMYDILMNAQIKGNTGLCAWTFYPSDVRVYMNEQTDALFLGRLSVRDYQARIQSLMEANLRAGTVPPIP